jgi:hypothetical protein
MKTGRLWPNLLLLAWLAPTTAAAAVKAELTTADGKAVAWTSAVTWKVQTEQRVPILYARVTLEPPAKPAVLRIDSKDAQVLSRAKDDKRFTLQLSSLGANAVAILEGGKRLAFRIDLRASEAETMSSGCENFNITLKPADSPKRPFVAGLVCQKQKDGALLTVTAPKDVAWGSTTIFESAGKGERWRQYVVDRKSLETYGDIGKVDLAVEGSSVTYVIAREKPLALIRSESDLDTDTKTLLALRFGVGAWMTRVTTSRANDAHVQPGFLINADTKVFFQRLKGGASVRLAMPMATSGKSADFFDLAASASLVFPLGAGTTLYPTVFFVSMVGGYDSGRVDFRYNKPGFGMEVRKRFQSGAGLLAAIQASAYVPSRSPTNYVGGTIDYFFPRGKFARLGIELGHRQYTVTSTTSGLANRFAVTLLNVMWAI